MLRVLFCNLLSCSTSHVVRMVRAPQTCGLFLSLLHRTPLDHNCTLSYCQGLSFLPGHDVIRFSNVESTMHYWDKPVLKTVVGFHLLILCLGFLFPHWQSSLTCHFPFLPCCFWGQDCTFAIKWPGSVSPFTLQSTCIRQRKPWKDFISVTAISSSFCSPTLCFRVLASFDTTFLACAFSPTAKKTVPAPWVPQLDMLTAYLESCFSVFLQVGP